MFVLLDHTPAMVAAAPLEKRSHDYGYSWMSIFELLTQLLKLLAVV